MPLPGWPTETRRTNRQGQKDWSRHSSGHGTPTRPHDDSTPADHAGCDGDQPIIDRMRPEPVNRRRHLTAPSLSDHEQRATDGRCSFPPRGELRGSPDDRITRRDRRCIGRADPDHPVGSPVSMPRNPVVIEESRVEVPRPFSPAKPELNAGARRGGPGCRPWACHIRAVPRGGSQAPAAPGPSPPRMRPRRAGGVSSPGPSR